MRIRLTAENLGKTKGTHIQAMITDEDSDKLCKMVASDGIPAAKANW